MKRPVQVTVKCRECGRKFVVKVEGSSSHRLVTRICTRCFPRRNDPRCTERYTVLRKVAG